MRNKNLNYLLQHLCRNSKSRCVSQFAVDLSRTGMFAQRLRCSHTPSKCHKRNKVLQNLTVVFDYIILLLKKRNNGRCDSLKGKNTLEKGRLFFMPLNYGKVNKIPKKSYS